MIRLVTPSDFLDIYLQAKWSYFKTILRTLRISGKNRTLSRWNRHTNMQINWYDVPYVVKHVQKNITGNGEIDYATYLVEKYFKGRSNIRMLSPGCGVGVKELQFAKISAFERIDGFDIAPARIQEAQKRSAALGLSNTNFFVGDIYDLKVEEKYDILLFDSCLHHFDNLDVLLEKVKTYLKPDGLLVIVEFTGPNRYQYTAGHVKKCNEALKLIPKTHRVFLKSSLVKQRVWAPGYIRMYLSDPSEGIRSGEILQAIYKQFNVVEEKKLGGDLLAPVLKGTVHHYIGNENSNHILDKLFEFENRYLKTLPQANHTFGVYLPK
jgi:ubiquinone/menaquinone biosynthesis C-methylase UbiE